MESLVLEVEKRETGGKGPARRVRMEGKLPGIFYGPGTEAMPLKMDLTTFERGIRGLEGTHLIQLKSPESDLDGKMVLVRDVQVEPVSEGALHVDLIEVPLDKPIDVRVPLHFVGKPEGVTLGGLLQPILRELHVSCLPTQIPESIDVDVTPLAIHDVLHENDLVLPDGAKLTRSDNQPVVSVQPPTVTEKLAGEEADAADAAPAAEGGEGDAKPAESSEGGDKDKDKS
ncbi:MAG: 50S ribosomal protein L25 [Candidatus Binatia bacterium]|nr:50S ribosomal protein L25 [Candidatus Binatia bacterium]